MQKTITAELLHSATADLDGGIRQEAWEREESSALLEEVSRNVRGWVTFHIDGPTVDVGRYRACVGFRQ